MTDTALAPPPAPAPADAGPDVGWLDAEQIRQHLEVIIRHRRTDRGKPLAARTVAAEAGVTEAELSGLRAGRCRSHRVHALVAAWIDPDLARYLIVPPSRVA